MLSTCLALFLFFSIDVDLGVIGLFCKIAAALAFVEFLKLLFFSRNWFYVIFCFINLQFEFLIFNLNNNSFTPSSSICFCKLSITASAVLNLSSCSYFWSHNRCTVAIIVTELGQAYMRSGRDCRLFFVFWSIRLQLTYRGLNFR